MAASGRSVPPFRSRDADRRLVSYAQIGEDVRLARVLWDRPPGFYVDVGAGDPVSNSVTRLFYDAGWRGINIEPGPAFARLEFARPRDVNLRLVVGTQEGERDFWVCRPTTELSSLLPLDPSSLPPGSSVVRERIRCRRLDAILEEHADAEIEFLKVDVEGAEGDVLASIDLRRFRPLVLVVEAIDPQTRRPSHERWQPRVLDSGYVHAAFDGVNRYYVPDERSELCEVLGYPLTPLDNFVPVAFEPQTDAIAAHERWPSPGPDDAGKDEPSEAPLTVILDGVEDSGLVSRVVPRGSSLLALRADSMQRSGETDGTHRYPATLEGLGHAVRAEPRYDVLIVSDTGALTRSGLDELRSTLATDSACTTASAGDGANHTTRTLPPAAVGPRRGVVLVRRDDLVLALDEARLLARGDVGLLSLPDKADLVDQLLASLVRPGFVHRLCGRAEPAEAHEPRPALRHAGQRVGDVVVDARCLKHPLSGTQVNVLGLLGGIIRAGADVSVLVPRDVHPTVSPNLVALRKAVPLIERVGPGRPTVFHRPFQIGSLKVLAACLSMGERLVLTHLDMISDRTPGYAGSTASWERYRSVTSAALSSADGLGFLSHHTANDAASDGVLDLDRVAVIHPGVDHLYATADGPGGSPRVSGRPYLLVVGNAYWHKNRPFALRLFRWLVEHRGWDGALVLIGQQPEPGSSRRAETAVLEEAPMLAERVIDLGRVTDAERDSLYRGAELVLFPSLSEGFGFVPFEAAAFGRPCAYARRSSMSELLPVDGALPSFDLEEAGPFVLGLLESEAARERLVAAVRAAAAPLTWDRAAAGYLALYARAAGSAPRGVSRTLVVSSPEGTSRTSEHEARVLDIYRRRRVFRVAVEAAIRAGSTRLRVPRRGPKD